MIEPKKRIQVRLTRGADLGRDSGRVCFNHAVPDDDLKCVLTVRNSAGAGRPVSKHRPPGLHSTGSTDTEASEVERSVLSL